jgi:hypothetical protein
LDVLHQKGSGLILSQERRKQKSSWGITYRLPLPRLATLHFAALGQGGRQQLSNGLFSVLNQLLQVAKLGAQRGPQFRNGPGKLGGILRCYDF